MKGKFPDYGVGDIAKELGKRWGVNTEKPRFEAMALKDKTRYAKVSVGCARVDVTMSDSQSESIWPPFDTRMENGRMFSV